eukprot:COSAG06_NODE_1180_length_10373_cov_14.852930_7_plen_262_part_00
MPRVWTKAGGLVRQAQDFSLPLPPSAPRTPEDRVIVRDYTARGAAVSFADSIGRLGLSLGEEESQRPLLAGLRIHDPNDYGDDGEVDDVATALQPDDGMLSGLRELRANGQIGHVSLGMNANRMAAAILRLLHGAPEGTFDSFLLAGGWNLLCQVRCVECTHERRRLPLYGRGAARSRTCQSVLAPAAWLDRGLSLLSYIAMHVITGRWGGNGRGCEAWDRHSQRWLSCQRSACRWLHLRIRGTHTFYLILPRLLSHTRTA